MTSCRLSPAVVTAQAERLLEATVRKVGTDEAAVTEISCAAKRSNCVAKLDQTVFDLMTLDERADFSDGIPSKTGSVISRIFQDELEGTDLSHAQDCLSQGRITHRDGRFEYFRDGVLDFFDLSSTDAKIGTAAVVGGLALLCLLSPPAAITAAAALMVGASVISGAAILKNGVEIMTQTDLDGRDDWRDLGHAAAGFVAATAPLPKVLPILRETWVPSVGPAVPFTHGAPSTGVVLKSTSTSSSPIPTVSDRHLLQMLLAPYDLSNPLSTRTLLIKADSTQLFKVKIHWRDGRITLFAWDEIEGLLFQVKDSHIVNADPGMWPLVPNLVRAIRQRMPLAHIEEISCIEVMEVHEIVANQLRPELGLPSYPTDSPF